MSFESRPLDVLYSHIAPGEALPYEREEGKLINVISYEYADVVEGFSFDDVNAFLLKESKATLHPELTEQLGWKSFDWKAFYQEGNETSVIFLGFKEINPFSPVSAIGSIFLSRNTPERAKLFGTSIHVAGTMLDSNQTKRVVAAQYMGFGEYHNGNLCRLGVSLINKELDQIKYGKFPAIPLSGNENYGIIGSYITPGMIHDASPDESEHRYLVRSHSPNRLNDNLEVHDPWDTQLTKFDIRKNSTNHLFTYIPKYENPLETWSVSIPSQLVRS